MSGSIRIDPLRRTGIGWLAFALSLSLVLVPGSRPALAAAGQIKEFLIPGNTPGPQSIALGSDGALWFTEINLGIGRLGPGGIFSNFSLSQGAQALDIVSGPDGALWFTETYNDMVGRLTIGGQLTEFLLCPTCGEGQVEPMSIAVGSDGALWFTEYEASAIGRITISGVISTFPLPPNQGEPLGITNGPDGALWFTNAGGIGRITTGGSLSQISNTDAYSITTGPDGNLWFSAGGVGAVGRLTPQGQVKLFSTPLNCYPQDIASGAGSLWFGCYYLDEIDRITTAGVLTRFRVPKHFPNYPDNIQGITQGPGGAMWFVEYAAERVGRVSTS